MSRFDMTRLVSMWLLVAVVSACSTADAVCNKQKECNPDLGDDAVRVCTEAYKGRLAALRANHEPECHVLADKMEALDACRAQITCDDFEAADTGKKCETELDDVDGAVADAETECTTLD